MTIATDRNAQDARSENDALRLAIADAAFLDVFIALSTEDKAIRWRMLDHGAKFRLIARQIERLGYEWDNELVAHWIAKYDDKYAPGPVEAAVEGALERLAQQFSTEACLAARIHDKAATREARRNYTAHTNALIAYRAGVRPQLLDSGAWLLPSRRAGEPPHIVSMDGDWICNCKAGASMHWPIALVIGCEVALDAMRDFDDGVVEIDEAAEAAQRLAERLEATQQTLDAYVCRGCGERTHEPGLCYGCVSRGEARAALGRRLCAARSRYDYAA